MVAALPTMDLIDSMDHATPLLTDMVDGAVDYKGQPLLRSSSATWRSASFIIGEPNLSNILSVLPLRQFIRDSHFRDGGC